MITFLLGFVVGVLIGGAAGYLLFIYLLGRIILEWDKVRSGNKG